MNRSHQSSKSPKSEVIQIIESRCKGCGFCIELCPEDVLEFAEHYNERGYPPPQLRDAHACIQCRICEYVCPDFAIFVTKRKRS